MNIRDYSWQVSGDGEIYVVCLEYLCDLDLTLDQGMGNDYERQTFWNICRADPRVNNMIQI
jgi:hypothetical protein